MKLNDEKLQEVKQKYEQSMKALETEIEKLQKQKDELFQQHKADPKSKVYLINVLLRIFPSNYCLCMH